MMELANFGDMALHDHEIRAVDVELHAFKDGLDEVSLGLMAIQEISRDIGKGDLTRS